MTTLTTATEIAQLALSLIGHSEALDITDITTDDTKEGKQANLHYEPSRDEILEMYPFKHAIEHRPLILSAGYDEFNEVYSYDPIDITNITKANPAVVTAATHGINTGQYGKIYDVLGMTEINRVLPYYLTASDANTLTLTGINSTNFTTYTSGGKVRLMEPLSKYQDGFVYDKPSDLAYALFLDGKEDFEIKGDYILTIQDDAVIVYVKNTITDVSKFKSLMIHAIATRMAWKMTIPILGAGEASLSLRDRLQKDEALAFQQAITVSALNKQETIDTSDSWTNKALNG